MVLFIADYERLEQSQCRRLRGRYTRLSRSAPLNLSIREWQRRSKQWWYMKCASLNPGTEGEQVLTFRGSSGCTEHKWQRWFYQQTVSVERLLFPGHSVLQVTEWVSKEMLWFLSWLFANFGLHRVEFRDLIQIQESNNEGHLKALFSKTIWNLTISPHGLCLHGHM